MLWAGGMNLKQWSGTDDIFSECRFFFFFNIFSRILPHVYKTGIPPLLDMPFSLARISNASAKPQIKRKYKNLSIRAELLPMTSKDGKSWRIFMFIFLVNLPYLFLGLRTNFL